MNKKLKPSEVVYEFNIEDKNEVDNKIVLPQYKEVYDEIKTSLLLNSYGYNMYLIDEFSKERENHIIEYVKKVLKNMAPPSDICYVIKDDPKEPLPLMVKNGNGNRLKKALNYVQDKFAEIIFKFYNALDNDEKEGLIEAIKDRRSKIVEELINMSKEFGFDIKVGDDGFTFVPLADGKEMTEEEYDELSDEERQKILGKISELKSSANKILDKLRNMSNDELVRLKEILEKYLSDEFIEINKEIFEEFSNDDRAMSYLSYVIKDTRKKLIQNYSISYEDDEDKIRDIIYKYDINVIVDNSKQKTPPVIFEEDPSVSNLLGSIEYENHNNMYVSTVDSIRAGSYIRCNEGCLIIRARSLFDNSQSYYYLKKSLISGKVNLDYNRGYLELFTLGGLRPVPIEVKTKVIIIGDYGVYSILYNYDKDFKNIFRIKAECRQVLDKEKLVVEELIKNVNKYIEKNKIRTITATGTKALAKYLARKAESRNKLYFDYDTLENLLLLADYKAGEDGKEYIDDVIIEKVAYKKDYIEEEYMKYYSEEKILLEVQGSRIGQINALSVIDIGYAAFGKPTRITCTCWKGDGKIIDAQRESSLSGNIHTKGISILRGYINNLNEGIKKLPVDFNLSFEQLYGLIDGDSASAAEILVVVSSLCRIPIKQNIAITGSVNQFGEIQAIGGVNEKIEGFFNICKMKGDIQGHGVVIPSKNASELVLAKEVENAVIEGDFSIYAIDTVEDAMKILFDMEDVSIEKVKEIIQEKCKLYEDEEEKEEK